MKAMDKEHKHHHDAGFSNGFLLGALVGGGLVFLLGTKKGKQVFKTLTENGFEGISELRDLLGDEDSSIVEEYMQDGEVMDAAPKVENTTPESVKQASKSIKRFFRGIKK